MSYFGKMFRNSQKSQNLSYEQQLKNRKQRYTTKAYSGYSSEAEEISALVGESSKGDRGHIVPTPWSKFESELELQTGYKLTGKEIITYDLHKENSDDKRWIQIHRGLNETGEIRISDFEWAGPTDRLPKNIIACDEYRSLLRAAREKDASITSIEVPGNMTYNDFRKDFIIGMIKGTRWDRELGETVAIRQRPGCYFKPENTAATTDPVDKA